VLLSLVEVRHLTDQSWLRSLETLLAGEREREKDHVTNIPHRDDLFHLMNSSGVFNLQVNS
jgi:hypothetical protein